MRHLSIPNNEVLTGCAEIENGKAKQAMAASHFMLGFMRLGINTMIF
jgi:hypothetical protein